MRADAGWTQRRRRAQSSLEFIILIAFLVIIFLGFASVIGARISEQQAANRHELLIQVADKIERELILASRVSPGYGREFELPHPQ